MTRQQYLLLCESLGQDPDPRVLPVELDDFPDIVRVAITVYNNLMDCYIPGEIPLFIGKDKSSLQVLFDIYGILPHEKELVLQIINIFDSRAVEASRKRAEKLGKKGKSGIRPGSSPAVPHSRVKGS